MIEEKNKLSIAGKIPDGVKPDKQFPYIYRIHAPTHGEDVLVGVKTFCNGMQYGNCAQISADADAESWLNEAEIKLISLVTGAQVATGNAQTRTKSATKHE